MQIAIVGAGVVGLSAAYTLAKSGCTVTVFDAQDIPNPASASYDRSRMMRLQYGPQSGYARLAQRALTHWEELQNTLGARLYRPTGVCVWSATAGSWTAATRHALDDAGVAYRDADTQANVFPPINRSALGEGVYTREGGVLLADRVVRTLATAAIGEGAVLHPRTPVLDVDTERGVVRTRAGDAFEADLAIVATGAWTPQLLPDFTNRLTPIRSIVVYVAPPAQVAADWAAAPCTMIETRESMLYILPPVPEAPMKLAGTANLRRADPDHPEPVSSEEAHAVLDAFRPYLPDIETYRIVGTAMGHYADPPDKTFVLERRNRAIIVSGCGGRMFKFAPLLASELAAVVTQAAPDTLLNHWIRPLTVSATD